MVALSPRPKDTVNATTLANCNPSPNSHNTVPDSTTGGPGDKLHPNRAGYLAMGEAIDLDLFRPDRTKSKR